MDVTVVVATYGDYSWITLAQERAMPSAERLGVSVLGRHDASLHEARNAGLADVDTEWVCFLDADDELEPGYFDHMDTGTADMRAPSVRYVQTAHRHGAVIMPKVAGHRHECTGDCLPFGNWLVIGTVVRVELLRQVGGFRDFPWSEDWDLWVRCWQAGATVEPIRNAVYRAHVRRDSRNRAPAHAEKFAAHCAIARANGLPVPA